MSAHATSGGPTTLPGGWAPLAAAGGGAGAGAASGAARPARASAQERRIAAIAQERRVRRMRVSFRASLPDSEGTTNEKWRERRRELAFFGGGPGSTAHPGAGGP